MMPLIIRIGVTVAPCELMCAGAHSMSGCRCDSALSRPEDDVQQQMFKRASGCCKQCAAVSS
eukprot:3137210-Alexandrium_andersonii.AAC.1